MSSTAILLTVLVVSGILLIRFAGKFILKFVGFLLFIPAVLVGLYALNLPPFSKNIFSRDNLNKKFCMKEENQDVCECVVKKYNRILEDKFSEDELKTIESKNYESAYIFTKLSDQLALQAAICSGSEDSAKVLMDKFVAELMPFGLSPAKGMAWLKEKTGEMKEKQERKEELDRKLKVENSQ